MKKCPFCAEDIQDAAIKCRYCGSALDQPIAPAPTAQTQTGPEPSPDRFEDAREMARQGNKINAIKLVRERTGWGLKEAKDFVESPAFGVPTTTKASSGGAGCLIAILVVGGAIWWFRSSPPAEVSKAVFQAPVLTTALYPESRSSYAEVDAEVGCKSKYSDDKKAAIFASQYRDHWMTWSGTVEISSASNASLNIDGKGFQDLAVDFVNTSAGYNLEKGERITVRFVMQRAGGCILPFSGNEATIVR